MFRTIIIDDEKLAVERLVRMLRPFKDKIDIISETTSSADAVKLINSLKPDLVFLDIQMPVYSGFDVLEKVSYTPLVIFTTAYDKYALKAFETNSVDYLLKPIDAERLKKTIDKLNNFKEKEKDYFEKQIKELLVSIKQPKQKRLSVKIGSKIMFIDYSLICFFKSSDKYVEVYTNERKYLITKSLTEIEEELKDNNFFRIHRSYIVNFDYIDSIDRTDTGEYIIKLIEPSGTKIPVSRYLKYKLGL